MRALALSPGAIAAAPRRRKAALRVHDGADNDVALVAAIAGGDRAAFGELFARFAPRVKGYLIRLGANPQLAEDLAQDCMVSIWRRAASFDPRKAKASTWIFVIARNAWIDRLRRERVELAYQASLDTTEVSDEEAPDDAVVRRQAESEIEAALERLSDEQREVVRLSFFEERPHSEIAERLSLPLGTVKSRLRLALAKLRTHWEQTS